MKKQKSKAAKAKKHRCTFKLAHQTPKSKVGSAARSLSKALKKGAAMKKIGGKYQWLAPVVEQIFVDAFGAKSINSLSSGYFDERDILMKEAPELLEDRLFMSIMVDLEHVTEYDRGVYQRRKLVRFLKEMADYLLDEGEFSSRKFEGLDYDCTVQKMAVSG